MILKVCAVRDSAMSAYHRPIFVPTLGVAIRSFTDEVQRADSEMSKHPADYELWYIGDYDDEQALFSNGTRECIARARDYIKQVN